jgi:hypothetical protein
MVMAGRRTFAGLLLASLLACRRGKTAAPAAPTAIPTPPPIAVVLTPTVSLPPQMGLDVKVDPALSRTIAANEPWTPAPATGSFRDRLQTQVPTTPFPTVAPNR